MIVSLMRMPLFSPFELKHVPRRLESVDTVCDDLPERIAELKQAGIRFRNDMEVGPGGKQIQLEDPDGNPIELFEPATAVTSCS